MNRTWLRHGLLAATVILGAAGAFGSLRSGDLPGNGDSWGVAVSCIGFAVLGWAVSGRRPELPIGWLFLAGGAVGAATFLATWWASQTLLNDPGSLPGGPFAAWLSLWMSALPWPLVLVAPLVLFPTGRVRSRRWFWFGTVFGAIIGILTITAAIVSLPVAARNAVELLDAPGVAETPAAKFASGLPAIARLSTFVAILIALVGLVVARRRAHGHDRWPYSTVLIGAAVVVVHVVIDALVPVVFGQQYGLPEAVGALTVVAVPTSIAIAVVRFQLYDVRTFVNRSVLVALTVVALSTVYLGVLALLAAVVGDRTPLTVPGILAADAVVVLSAPVAAAATRTTRRWFRRAIPSTSMATRFTESLPVEANPYATAQALAETLRAELRLGSIALDIEGLGSTTIGEPSGPFTSLELRYGQRRVGEVLVTARQGETRAAIDLRMLREIAGYVSIAAEAIRIGEALRRAQLDLENAQSEERRRVRRDLHDDVGPTLASARLKLASYRRQLPVESTFDEIIDQIADAIRGIRRVVDGLQPSVLEDVGLVPALQILLTDLRQTTGIHITFDAPPTLPDLSAATASAAYRVVAEALTNVVRHSGATLRTLRVEHHDGMLHIEEADNGHGFTASMPSGMGLRNIVDRAGSANGVATIHSAPDSGTTVVLDVPL